MSKRRRFSDLMWAEATDFEALGQYDQAARDDLVSMLGTTGRAYSGCAVSKTGDLTVQVGAGLVIQADPTNANRPGAIYKLTDAVSYPMTQYLAVANKVMVAIAIKGQTVNTDVSPRTFAVDADSEEGIAQDFAQAETRQVGVAFYQGVESVNPAVPAVPSDTILIAVVTMGTTGVDTVEQITTSRMASLADVTDRTAQLEAWRLRDEPKVAGLVSDLALLTVRTAAKAEKRDLIALSGDVARLKEVNGLPDGYAQYGSDNFDDDSETDVDETDGGSVIDAGLLFPPAAEASLTLDLFNANDPAAVKHTNGLILPSYTTAPLFSPPPVYGDMSLSQFAAAAHSSISKRLLRARLLYGYRYSWDYLWYAYYRRNPSLWRYLYKTSWPDRYGWWKRVSLLAYLSGRDPITGETIAIGGVTTVYNGIMSAQTFPAARGTWFRGVNLFFTSLAASGPVHVFLVDTELGQPVMGETFSAVTMARADLKLYPQKTWCPMPPVLLEAGKMYAIVLITEASHRVATVDANTFREGTYFAGTDGQYFVGDLTKDIWIEPMVCQFDRPRTEMVLQTLSLGGGFTDLDLETEQIVPDGTELDYQVDLGSTYGAGWRSLSEVEQLAQGPNLAQFRAVAVGTRDLQPGFYAGANRVKVSRAATTMHHVSEEYTLAAPSDEIIVDYDLHGFDAGEGHTLDPTLVIGMTTEAPDTEEDIPGPNAETLRKRFTFNIAAPTSAFVVDTEGDRDTGAPFVVTGRTHVAL